MTTLRARDVFLYPEDFDPLLPVAPHHIPLEELKWEDGQATWTRVFKGEEFRTFWHNERVAMQFEHRQEGRIKGDITQTKLDIDQLLPIKNATAPGAPGSPRLYDWSLLFRCRRHRRPKELILKRDSVGVNCPAMIRIRKICFKTG
ncbi:MAG: hypothetical protein J3R72DRAFT_493740 [Linnemannia gamsii]|nr:MAG: hypothetical protein J3R72DRAFT_493740 [Linnemannia gamsii]